MRLRYGLCANLRGVALVLVMGGFAACTPNADAVYGEPGAPFGENITPPINIMQRSCNAYRLIPAASFSSNILWFKHSSSAGRR